MRLPFEHFAYTPDRTAIRFSIGYDDTVYRCTLVQPVCAVVPPDNPGRPRGFGVVRDLRVPADNHPRLSPDRRLEALVLDDNLVVRAAGDGKELWRSQDGSPADFYDPESIAWSPDGQHIALQRVRPGYARMVTRVLAAPPGKVQPEVVQQLYPKPGDAVDQETPVLFRVSDGKRTDIDPACSRTPIPCPPRMAQRQQKLRLRRSEARFRRGENHRGRRRYRAGARRRQRDGEDLRLSRPHLVA